MILGGNLLNGTLDFSGDRWVNLFQWVEEKETYRGLKVMSRDKAWFGLYQPYSVAEGETYTFSFYAKIDNPESVQVDLYLDGGDNSINPYFERIAVDTHFKRFGVTFTAKADTLSKCRLEKKGNTGGKLYVAGYRLDEGDAKMPYFLNWSDLVK